MEEEDEEVPEAVPLFDNQVSCTEGPRSETEQKKEEKRQPWRPVPVTLISGFLGAGKTTLVNYVLSAKHGFRVAVVLNEFGESAGIEKALLNDSKGEDAFELQDWVELSNGCLCCSVKNEFVQALEALMTKRDKFDYVLIECSGLADPGPVATALWTDAELESGVCLDAIVTVVDANNIQRQVSSKRESGTINEAQTQIAYADVLLLNKVDTLPDEGALNAIESLIKSINGRASIIRTNRCQVNLGQILDRGSFDPGQASRHADDISGAMSEEMQGSGDNGGHTQGEHPAGHQLTQAHHHDAGIRTVSITLPGYVQLDRLRHWLDFLLWERPSHKEDILRLKGLVILADGAGRRVIQAVHEVYDIFAARPLQDGESQLNQVVLIGRNLDEEYLTNSFRQCLADQGDNRT